MTVPTVTTPRLSVVVLTHNEEANLPDCLASLTGLAADVYVVDSGSTDRTIAIAKEHGAQVVSHPFDNYAAQRNWAQANLLLKTEWVLHLDADERLTPELVTEIGGALRHPPPNVNGYLLRKRTIFMGRWIRHGAQYPSYHLRLFRKDMGRCEERLYDQHFLVSGKTARLRHDYNDVITSDLSTWTMRHLRWADLEGQELLKRQAGGASQVQAKLFGTPIERKRWLRGSVFRRSPMFLRAFAYGWYRYVLRFGFLDGKEGLIFHFLQGVWYRFVIDAKLYERELRLRKQGQGKAR